MHILGNILVNSRLSIACVSESILDFWGPYAKLGGFTPSRITLVERAQETVYLLQLTMLSTHCFSLEQESKQLAYSAYREDRL